MYLRLNRVKKSVNFTDAPITKQVGSSSSPNGGHASRPSAAANTVDDAAMSHPYAPTADLPVQQKPKRAAPTEGKGKERKVDVDGADGAAEAEDDVAQPKAVNKTTVPAKKQKQKQEAKEKALQKRKNGKTSAAVAAVAVHIDKAAYEAAAAYANAMHPIPATEDEDGADKKHGDGGW